MTPDFGPALPSPCTHVESGIRLWVARYCQMLCMSPDQAAFFLMPLTKGTPSITSVIN